jgi:hypothetical protein
MSDTTNTVKRVFSDLGVHEGMKTDPVIFQSILDEMELLDLESQYDPVRTFFTQATNTPQEIDTLLESVQRSLSADYPMIVEFLEMALTNRWLRPSPTIVWSLHVGVILETLTAAMLESNDFTLELQQHINAKRRSFGISTESGFSTFTNCWRITNSMFLAAKVVTVDPALSYFIFRRQHLDNSKDNLRNLFLKGKLSFVEYLAELPVTEENPGHHHDGLLVNIMEACVTELQAGFEDNALCAHTLMLELQKAAPAKNAANEIEPLSRDWISLYESWNGAFILGEIEDLPLVLPKLFIPSVLGASPQKYVEARTYSLWLTLNALLFKELKGKTVHQMDPSSSVASLFWGSINERYAISFAEKHLGKDQLELLSGFRQRFRWPRLRFLLFVLKCIARRG